MLVAGLEASQRNHEQANLFTIWAIVLFIQIAAVVVFICNVLIDYFLKHKAKQKNRNDFLRFNKQDPPQHFAKPEGQQPMLSEPLVYQAEQRPGEYSQDISKFTKVLIHKIHGGRKKDSKFWNDQIDLTKEERREIFHTDTRKLSKNSKTEEISPNINLPICNSPGSTGRSDFRQARPVSFL